MNYLALDCSTLACTIALKSGTEVLTAHWEEPRGHNRFLLPGIASLLDQAGITVSQLDGIVAGIGPGSFVGVRMAVSVAQGLAFGADLPLLGVSSLQVWAQTLKVKCTSLSEVLLALDARLGQITLGHYQLKDGIMQPKIVDQVLALEALVIPERVEYVLGDAFNTLLPVPARALYLQDCFPHAAAMFDLVNPLDFASAPSPDHVLPVYLQGTSPWKKSQEHYE